MASLTAEIKTHERGKSALEIVKALTIAIVLSLLFVLLFALLIKAANIPDSWIAPVIQVIKAISLLTGSLMSFRIKSGGWKKGLIFGAIYVVLAYAIFSLLDGAFKIDISLLYDLLLGTAMGTICGIIAVNIGSRKKL